MQPRQKLEYIAIAFVMLLSGVVLLMDTWAQALQKTQIAFDSNRDGNYEIYAMDADGKNQRNLTKHPADDLGPARPVVVV
jgi:hypothetical protein